MLEFRDGRAQARLAAMDDTRPSMAPSTAPGSGSALTTSEANVRAKTGSVRATRALSGYRTTAGGRQVVFSPPPSRGTGSGACRSALVTAEARTVGRPAGERHAGPRRQLPDRGDPVPASGRPPSRSSNQGWSPGGDEQLRPLAGRSGVSSMPLPSARRPTSLSSISA